MTRAAVLPWIACLTCLMGQACTPLVYELATAGETTHQPYTSDGPGSSSGDTSDTTEATGPGDPTDSEPPSSCKDGGQSGDETDVDCGGPCPPCRPGQQCEVPQDCDFGLCVDGRCDKPSCDGPKDCPPPGDPCLLPACDAGQCTLLPAGDGAPCDDGDACSLGEACFSGKCSIKEKVDCSKFDGPCRAGVCNPGDGSCAVEWLFEGEPCKDDGLDCNFGALCSAGECVAPPPPPPLLFTDFSLAGGWTAEPPWQIGPAMASKCGEKFADDPDLDTSPSADDHIAGAAIGGCLPTDPFAKGCLVSPPIDAFTPGELWLSYMALLNTAGAPMISSVEIFDAKSQTWLAIVTVDEFFAEGKWAPHAHDLTAFKGPELRVRFCHGADGPSPAVGGWSIDDLAIGPPLCGP